MDKVADAIGVKRKTLEKAIDVVEAAEEDPQMFGDLPEMMDEKRKVDGAYREMKKRIAQDQAAQEAQRAPHKATVRKMDAIEFLEQMPVQSVDLLLTDPPYMTDVADINEFAASWVAVALDRLKATGRAYIFTGAYPQELAAYLGVLLPACAERELVLANVLVWTYENTLGPSPKDDYKLNWQAAFYIRGPDAPPLNCPIMLEQFTVQKVRAPDGRLGDRYHAWQKPDELAERLIRHSTVADQLVVDPFAGTGTFILAAARLGRYAYGCDNSDAMLEIARQRGCDYEQ
jgi:DNA modification methylase